MQSYVLLGRSYESDRAAGRVVRDGYYSRTISRGDSSIFQSKKQYYIHQKGVKLPEIGDPVVALPGNICYGVVGVPISKPSH